jgi:hypothetical protein
VWVRSFVTSAKVFACRRLGSGTRVGSSGPCVFCSVCVGLPLFDIGCVRFLVSLYFGVNTAHFRNFKFSFPTLPPAGGDNVCQSTVHRVAVCFPEVSEAPTSPRQCRRSRTAFAAHPYSSPLSLVLQAPPVCVKLPSSPRVPTGKYPDGWCSFATKGVPDSHGLTATDTVGTAPGLLSRLR